jgi:hypothetical protein
MKANLINKRRIEPLAHYREIVNVYGREGKMIKISVILGVRGGEIRLTGWTPTFRGALYFAQRHGPPILL